MLRDMKENARQSFYNGSPVPLGYRTQEVEKRGARVKKQLAIGPVEAETVRMIFRLYKHGEAASGPLGIKEITKRLNAAGHRTKRGARFGVGTLHGILTNTVYVGEWVFNKREAKTLRQKPSTEHITVAVPAIIERAAFDVVQATLKARNPRVEAPRVVTGPIRLAGLADRYYTCSACARSGKTACKGAPSAWTCWMNSWWSTSRNACSPPSG